MPACGVSYERGTPVGDGPWKHPSCVGTFHSIRRPAQSHYRATSLIEKSPPPYASPGALGIVLLQSTLDDALGVVQHGLIELDVRRGLGLRARREQLETGSLPAAPGYLGAEK